MKTMSLTQQLNPEFKGDHTPNVDHHQYLVTKVMNSLSPLIGDCLTKKQASRYCHNLDWNVVIT